MKNYIYLLFLLGFFASCEESELTMFSEKDSVYFQLREVDYDATPDYWDDWLDYKGDSIAYSFKAIPPESEAYLEKDTLWLMVNLTGVLKSHERQINISVNANESTAEEGVHYEALEMSYPFPADTMRATLPIILYNDESLGEEPFVLKLELEANDDFDLGLEGRTEARIQIYNDVVKPLIWDSKLYQWLGPYSKAKHRVVLLTNGGIPVPHTAEEYSALQKEHGAYVVYYWKAPMNAYLIENEVYDEDGNRVMPW